MSSATRTFGTKAEELAKQKAVAEEHRRLEVKLRGDDYRAVMNTEAGRRFVRRLLNDCHLESSIFVPDAMKLSYDEGQRSVAARLAKELQVEARDQYVLMVEEAVERLPKLLPPSVLESLKD